MTTAIHAGTGQPAIIIPSWSNSVLSRSVSAASLASQGPQGARAAPRLPVRKAGGVGVDVSASFSMRRMQRSASHMSVGAARPGSRSWTLPASGSGLLGQAPLNVASMEALQWLGASQPSLVSSSSKSLLTPGQHRKAPSMHQHRQPPTYQRTSSGQLKRPPTPQQREMYAYDARFKDHQHKQDRRDRFNRLNDWIKRVDTAKQLHRERTQQRLAWQLEDEGSDYGPPPSRDGGRPSSVAAARAAPSRPRPNVQAQGPPAGAPADDDYEKRRERGRQSGAFRSAEQQINSRFTDMKKAFRFVDTDNSGTLDKKEIRRAMDMWNIPIDDEKLDDLIAACDTDGDGHVVYNEFVDVLARDTVAPAAMGKRDMQSQEAMGESAYKLLDEMIAGGPKKKAFDPSINAS
jgi:hypothetical protein